MDSFFIVDNFDDERNEPDEIPCHMERPWAYQSGIFNASKIPAQVSNSNDY